MGRLVKTKSAASIYFFEKMHRHCKNALLHQEKQKSPIFPTLFSLVAFRFVLVPGAVTLQRFRAFSSLVLAFPAAGFCSRIFGIHMGFTHFLLATNLIQCIILSFHTELLSA